MRIGIGSRADRLDEECSQLMTGLFGFCDRLDQTAVGGQHLAVLDDDDFPVNCSTNSSWFAR